MPHERNEERRRGIGFQEVLKSIREPFLTLVFSRNDCSQILEIFFSFFPPFFPEILAWILSVDSHVLHTEIILLILLFTFFQYFFFPLQHPLYTVIYVHFDFSFHRRNDESSNFNYRPHLVKKQTNSTDRKLVKSASKMIPRKYYPHDRFLPTNRFAESRTNETNNDQSLV